MCGQLRRQPSSIQLGPLVSITRAVVGMGAIVLHLIGGVELALANFVDDVLELSKELNVNVDLTTWHN